MREPREVSLAMHNAAARLVMVPAELEAVVLHAANPALRQRAGEIAHQLTATQRELFALALGLSLASPDGGR